MRRDWDDLCCATSTTRARPRVRQSLQFLEMLLDLVPHCALERRSNEDRALDGCFE
jgi:hypothetical protein